MLAFVDGWTDDNNPVLTETVVKGLVTAAVESYGGEDSDFLDLKSMVLSTNALGKAKVVKGMHQDEGNAIIVERHITVELPWFPHTKRYHIYYWQDKKKKAGWYPVSISHEQSKGIYKKVSV